MLSNPAKHENNFQQITNAESESVSHQHCSKVVCLSVCLFACLSVTTLVPAYDVRATKWTYQPSLCWTSKVFNLRISLKICLSWVIACCLSCRNCMKIDENLNSCVRTGERCMFLSVTVDCSSRVPEIRARERRWLISYSHFFLSLVGW